MKPFSFKKRLIALFVLSAFLVTNLDVSYAKTVPANNVPAPSNIEIHIPEKFGKLESGLQPVPGKRTVIYIQDAHDSLEAQKNIALLIRHLVKRYGVKTVFEEGFEGPVPTESVFGFMKNAAAKEKVSYFLMDKLRIGGAEYAHINSKNDFELIGVDDRKLHHENIEWYRKNARFREVAAKDLSALRKQIDGLADRSFPKALKEWKKLRARLDDHQISFPDYLKRFLAMNRDVSGCSLSGYPRLEILLKAEETGGTSVENLDAKALFTEIETMEHAFAESFLGSAEDKTLFEYDRALSLLIRLNEIQLTSSEFEAAKDHLGKMNTREIAEFIVSRTNQSLVLSKQWERYLKNAVRFYETALGRDEAVEKNIERYFSAESGIAVLVFGGFHEKGITDRLLGKGYSVVSVLPNITGQDMEHQAAYKQLMAAGHYDFEKPFLPARAASPERGYSWNSALLEIRAIYDEARVSRLPYPLFAKKLQRKFLAPAATVQRSRAESRPLEDVSAALSSYPGEADRQAYTAERPRAEREQLDRAILGVGKKMNKQMKEEDRLKLLGLLDTYKEEKALENAAALLLRRFPKQHQASLLAELKKMSIARRLDPRSPDFDIIFWIYKVLIESETTEIGDPTRDLGEVTADMVYEQCIDPLRQLNPHFDPSDIMPRGGQAVSKKEIAAVMDRGNLEVLLPRNIYVASTTNGIRIVKILSRTPLKTLAGYSVPLYRVSYESHEKGIAMASKTAVGLMLSKQGEEYLRERLLSAFREWNRIPKELPPLRLLGADQDTPGMLWELAEIFTFGPMADMDAALRKWEEEMILEEKSHFDYQELLNLLGGTPVSEYDPQEMLTRMQQSLRDDAWRQELETARSFSFERLVNEVIHGVLETEGKLNQLRHAEFSGVLLLVHLMPLLTAQKYEKTGYVYAAEKIARLLSPNLLGRESADPKEWISLIYSEMRTPQKLKIFDGKVKDAADQAYRQTFVDVPETLSHLGADFDAPLFDAGTGARHENRGAEEERNPAYEAAPPPTLSAEELEKILGKQSHPFRQMPAELFRATVMAGIFLGFSWFVYRPYVQPWVNQSQLHLISGMIFLSAFKSTIVGWVGLRFARFVGETKSKAHEYQSWIRQILYSLFLSVPIFGFFITSWAMGLVPVPQPLPEKITQALIHQGILAPLLYDPLHYITAKMMIEKKPYAEVTGPQMAGNILNYTGLAFIFWFPANWIALLIPDLSWRFIFTNTAGFAWGVAFLVMLRAENLGFLRSLGIARGKTFEEAPQPLNPFYWLYRYYQQPWFGLSMLSATYWLYTASLTRQIYLLEPSWSYWVPVLASAPWLLALFRSRQLITPSASMKRSGDGVLPIAPDSHAPERHEAREMEVIAIELEDLIEKKNESRLRIFQTEQAPVTAFIFKHPKDMKLMFQRMVLYSLPTPSRGIKLITAQEVDSALHSFLGFMNWFFSRDHIAGGFAARASELAEFFNVYSADELSQEEKEMLKEVLRAGLIHKADGKYAGSPSVSFFAAYPHHNAERFKSTLREELSHAFFISHPDYRSRVAALWESLPENARTAFFNYLRKSPLYSKAVLSEGEDHQGYDLLIAEFAGQLRNPYDDFFRTEEGRSENFSGISARLLDLETDFKPGTWKETDARAENQGLPFTRDDQGLLVLNPEAPELFDGAMLLDFWRRLERDGLRYEQEFSSIPPRVLSGHAWLMTDLREEDTTTPLKNLEELKAKPLKLIFPNRIRLSPVSGLNNNGMFINYAEGLDRPILIKTFKDQELTQIHNWAAMEIFAAQINDFAGTGPVFYGVTVDPRDPKKITGYGMQIAAGGFAKTGGNFEGSVEAVEARLKAPISVVYRSRMAEIKNRLSRYGLDVIDINYLLRSDGTVTVIDAGDLILGVLLDGGFNQKSIPEARVFEFMNQKREKASAVTLSENRKLPAPAFSQGNSVEEQRSITRLMQETNFLRQSFSRLSGSGGEMPEIERVEVGRPSPIGTLRKVYNVTLFLKGPDQRRFDFVMKISRSGEQDNWTLLHEAQDIFIAKELKEPFGGLWQLESGQLVTSWKYYPGLRFNELKDDTILQRQVISLLLKAWKTTGNLLLTDVHRNQFVVNNREVFLVDRGLGRVINSARVTLHPLERGELEIVSPDTDLNHLSLWLQTTTPARIFLSIVDGLQAPPPVLRDAVDSDKPTGMYYENYELDLGAVADGIVDALGIEEAAIFLKEVFEHPHRTDFISKWRVFIQSHRPELARKIVEIENKTPHGSTQPFPGMLAGEESAIAPEAVIFADGTVSDTRAEKRAEELAVIAAANPGTRVVIYNDDGAGALSLLLKAFKLRNIKFFPGELRAAAAPYQSRTSTNLVEYKIRKSASREAVEANWLTKRLTRFSGDPGALEYGLRHLDAVLLNKQVDEIERVVSEDGEVYYRVSSEASGSARFLQEARYVTVFARAA